MAEQGEGWRGRVVEAVRALPGVAAESVTALPVELDPEGEQLGVRGVLVWGLVGDGVLLRLSVMGEEEEEAARKIVEAARGLAESDPLPFDLLTPLPVGEMELEGEGVTDAAEMLQARGGWRVSRHLQRGEQAERAGEGGEDG